MEVADDNDADFRDFDLLLLQQQLSAFPTIYQYILLLNSQKLAGMVSVVRERSRVGPYDVQVQGQERLSLAFFLT